MKTIVTHDGGFHADDVFAIAVLSIFFNGDVSVIRTRDKSLFDSADFVVDVGLRYDNQKFFDHHQKDGAGERFDKFPYAAFGIVWKKFGHLLPGSSEEISNIIDQRMVKWVDANDCGFGQTTKQITLSNVVSSFNTIWHEGEEKQQEYFFEAVEFAKHMIKRQIEKAKGDLMSTSIIEEAIKNRKDKKILVLERFTPWDSVVIKNHPEIMFVIFKTTDNKLYMTQAVPIEKGSFICKKFLPKNWGGLNDEDLVKATGVADATFCHNKLFIAGAKTLEGALKLAEIAMAS